MSETKKKKPKKLKKYVVGIRFSAFQTRFFEASSAKEARQMFEDGNFDTEYDFDECCEDEEVEYVKEVK